MRKFKKALKDHWLIIVTAFFLTVLVSSPLIAFYFRAGSAYQGINIEPYGVDEHFYLTRGKEVLEGHGLGNPMLREGKNEKTDYYFNVAEYVLLAPIRILGLSNSVDIVTVYNIYNFVGVFTLALLMYFLMLRLSGDKLLAVSATAFAIGGHTIIYNKWLFYKDFDIYGRSLYPYISSLVFFSYLILLLKSLQLRSRMNDLVTGLVFGLTFYIYFYLWSFIAAVNAVLFLLFLIKKDWANVKKIFSISFVGGLIGLYNLFRIFSFDQLEAGKKFFYFAWLSHSHAPSFSNLGFFALLIFAVYAYKHWHNKNTIFILALILGGWIALNQQIITGKVAQQNHYYWYFVVPIAVLTGFYMSWSFIYSQRLKIAATAAVLFVVLINMSVGQYRSALEVWSDKLHEQNYRPILDTLNKDQKPAVVLTTEDQFAFLFTIYTPHDVFWAPFAEYNDIPIQKFKDNIFVYLYLNRITRNDIGHYLLTPATDEPGTWFYRRLYRILEGYWSGMDYYVYNRLFYQNSPLLLEQRKANVALLEKEYKTLVEKPGGIENLLKNYGVKYIVWDKNNYPEWDLSPFKDLHELKSFNNIYLYEFSSP